MDGDRESRLRHKQLFYAGLNAALDSDGEDDPGLRRSMEKMKKGRELQKARVKQDMSLARSVSDTNLMRRSNNGKIERVAAQDHVNRPSTSDGRWPRSSIQKDILAAESRPSPGPIMPTGHLPNQGTTSIKLTTTAPIVELKPLSMKTGKRKREPERKRASDQMQIFKGLRFYFFPDNDKHPARKIRIQKAIEFGAVWEQQWGKEVTHVIVDQRNDFSQVMTYLKKNCKLECIPPQIIVVSEHYPAECIGLGMLADAKLRQFSVKGYNRPVQMKQTEIVPENSGSTPSAQSLQLKTGKRPKATASPNAALDRAAAETQALKPIGNLVPSTALAVAQGDLPTLEAKPTSEFDEAIRQAKALGDIFTDSDAEEGDSRPSSSGDTSSSGESSNGPRKRPSDTLAARKGDYFQCMHEHTGDKAEGPNDATIAMLQQMADFYESIRDEWRIRAYRMAISSLKKATKKIWTKEEALLLPKVGERLAAKIEEIAFTNRLRRLENAQAEPSDQALKRFLKVYGAGYATAKKWVDSGFTTLEDLRQNGNLTEGQRIGIDHYEDFDSRIPRAEVKQHGDIVRRALQQIDSRFEMVIGGSYRRGAKDSGDIDCLITHPHHSIGIIRDMVLNQAVPMLEREGFLVATLSETSRIDGSKWHGASCLPPKDGKPNPWRRIDLLLVPAHEFGAALIYFTGNDIFNRSMRLLAGRKTMRLNQRGLYADTMRGRGRVKITEGRLVEGRDEKKIFEALGVPWRPPEHRNC